MTAPHAACCAMPDLQPHRGLHVCTTRCHATLPGSQNSAEKPLYLLNGVPRPGLHQERRLPGSWTGQDLSAGSALPATSTFSSHIRFLADGETISRGAAPSRQPDRSLRDAQEHAHVGRILSKFHNSHPCLVVE